VELFVAAALVATMLFVDRLGGTDQFTRRLYQVALGFGLAFAVTSGTDAFLRVPLPDLESIFDAPPEQLRTLARQSTQASAIQSGFALAFVLVGLLLAQRLTTLSLSLVLAGLLLLLESGAGAGDDGSLSFVGSSLGNYAGQTEEIVHFAVLAAGTLGLLVFGYFRWETKSLRTNEGTSS
jgi:hypothetical protein